MAPPKKKRPYANERSRYPSTCGIRDMGKSSRNKKTDPVIVIDHSSWSLAELEKQLAKIQSKI